MAKGSRIHIPYTVTRIGKDGEVRYLHLSKKLKAMGVTPKTFGLKKTVIGRECPDTRKRAREIQTKCEALLRGEDRLREFTPGTFGQIFAGYMGAQKRRLERGEIKRRTYEEFQQLWDKHIKRDLAELSPDEITVECLTDFKYSLEDRATEGVRHKVMAKLSMILRDATIRGVFERNPCEAIPNPAPNRRCAFWLSSEWQQLIDAAPTSLALVLRIMHETARNPVDAHQLPLNALRIDADGPYIDRSREKTGVEGMQAISMALYDDLRTYYDALPFAVLPDLPFLMRPVDRRAGLRMQPWKDESEFAKDFRRLRISVFGEQETRTAKDIRKTANLEAQLGGAKPEERAALLANALHRNAALDQVYTPPTLVAARKARETREAGRLLLEAMPIRKNNRGTA